jgi:mono/diheme cytochrome c family protein
MPFTRSSYSNLFRYVVLGLPVIALAILAGSGSRPAAAQEAKTASGQSLGSGDLVARGRYIVEDVAKCGNCHTPYLADGELDRSRWLAGAPDPFLPAQPSSDWPINCPRIGGTPPTTDAGMITLLTTAVWIDGKPLRAPMPRFHMSRSDAEAVLAYLKSLR